MLMLYHIFGESLWDKEEQLPDFPFIVRIGNFGCLCPRNPTVAGGGCIERRDPMK